MAPITIELPIRSSYHDFNRNRWEEILRDPELAKFAGKVETNRHGHILMMPPASGRHSQRQGEILFTLQTHLGGKALPECPVSTCNGVRSADVGWFSKVRFERVAGQTVFEEAPEICVEVLSPSNTPDEMEEKKNLYFAAGAEEVWLCSEEGSLTFFSQADPENPQETSSLYPDFPEEIE